MRILFYTFANREMGLGHWFRCLALAEIALNRGHKVAFASDRKPPFGAPFYPSVYLLEDGFVRAYNHFYPEWIVADLPVAVPDFVMNLSTRKCLIDGIGHDAQAKADLNISQGFDGKYCAPDYLLLRQHMILNPAIPKPREGMFVFGGGADKLGLAKRFVQSCKDIPANIVISPMVDWVEMPLSDKHTLYTLDNNQIFSVMKASTGAAVHMGMNALELARDQIAPHIFSYTIQHLESAKELECRGYALAYDMIGLPDKDSVLLDFLQRPTIFMGDVIDGRGTERVIKLMEKG